MNSLGTFSISAEQSRDFARASGDFNPLHLDPVAARRTRFGQTLIHGVCGTIKCLDLLLSQRTTACELVSIKVKYNKPATQGQALETFEQTGADGTRLELFADGSRCQIIDLILRDTPDADNGSPVIPGGTSNGQEMPVDLDILGCSGVSGTVELRWDPVLMHALFPSASRLLPASQLAALLASTHIVGMRCPGLHSVFARLEMQFSGTEPEAATGSSSPLAYHVISTDPRIDRVQLELGGANVAGTIEAFFRPPPVQQARFEQIAALVDRSEFQQQNALVVGASRGLGEVIAKVLAAGGANVMMTYAAGEDDAARVADEIARDARRPAIAHYNALEGTMSDEMAAFCASASNLYYLASPTIAKSDSNKWDRQLFARYCDFYIDGLATLLQQFIRRDANSALQLFIPSSVFLEQNIKGFDEYIAAKSAAEAFVNCFATNHHNCTVAAPRLPRLYTDQTSGVKNIDEQETLNVIIGQLRLAAGAEKCVR